MNFINFRGFENQQTRTFLLEKEAEGAGEMAQQLGALAILGKG